MARPQKSPEERQSEQVNFRLSPLELAKVRDRADKMQTSVTDFVRTAALDKPLKVQESITPDFATRNELRRIGSNLNQIARVLNAGGKHDSDDLSALITKLDTLFDRWLDHGSQSRQIRHQL